LVSKKHYKWSGLAIAACLLLGACSNNGNGGNGGSGNDGAASSGSSAGSEASAPANLNKEGFPIVNDTVTLKVMGAKAPIQGAWDQFAFFREMEKKTNISLKFDTPPVDSFNEKLNLAFATNSLPDFIFGTANNLTPSEAYQFGSQGMLVPLEELIKNDAPNIQKLLDDNPEYRKSLTSPDGHIYTLPRIDAGFGLYWPKFWINSEWLKELNLQTPTTLDELTEVLKAFKAKDGNVIPMTSMKLDDIRPGFMNAYGYVMDNKTFFAIQNDKVVFVPAQPEFKEYVSYLNNLYEQKLLDPETFTQTRQQMQAKGNDGRLGFFFDAASFLTVGQENNKSYTMLSPLVANTGQQPIAVKNNPLSYGAFAITSHDADPEATIRWVDYLFSKEGAILESFGVEGEHWKSTADGGIQRLIPDGKSQAEFLGQGVTPDVGATNPPEAHQFIDDIAQIGEEQNNPQNYAIRREVDQKLMPYVQDGFPLLHFTEDEQKQIDTLQTDLTTYVHEMEAKFVIGVEPLDHWDSYVDTLNKMNAAELTKLYQQAYDRWKQQ
jgi:putative aldouronate transport system substrate-binding protein